MRAPPPVEQSSALTFAWRAILALVAGASVASLLAWALAYAPISRLADPVVGAVVALTVGGLVALVVGWGWKSGAASQRTLRWDGQDWVLVCGRAERRGDAALMLDLGPWMLVRFLPQGGMEHATWLPLTAGPDAARWAALRGALWNWRSHAGAAR